MTAFTKDKFPIRTLSRRVDGAFPNVINPITIWEIKVYYFTTTFGSRVADGVYETWLDGLELREVKDNLHIPVEHFLIVDDHFTWWVKGRSYLCRIFDMLHTWVFWQKHYLVKKSFKNFPPSFRVGQNQNCCKKVNEFF